MITISLCMIVKNEENIIERCLESIKSAADEIIIVDTGSTDSTKLKASKYTDKIYDFVWINDFSAARNFSFSKATKDYIMWLDADDVIPETEAEKLINLKKNLDTSADFVYMTYNTAFDDGGKPTFSFKRERLFKRSASPVWRDPVHEYIEINGKGFISDISVNHYSQKKEYGKRNLNIYRKYIKNGKPLSPRMTFYYARELFYHGYYKQSIKQFNSFLSGEGWLEDKICACRHRASCFMALNDTESALGSLFYSFTLDLPRAETACAIARIFFDKNRLELSAYWYEAAMRARKNQSSAAFSEEDCYVYLPAIQLAVIYDKLKDRRTASVYNEIAGAVKPYSKAYLHNKQYFEMFKDKTSEDKQL